MNTQKTPEQWFQKLKEPYRSEAIRGINKEVQHFKEYPESLLDALYFSLHWGEPFKPTPNDWDVIYNSIREGETTYLEPETLKPEQMESGKWYVVRNKFDLEYLVKVIKIDALYFYIEKGIILESGEPEFASKLEFSRLKSFRPAINELVLKYFPDEVFEPIAEYKEILSKIDLNVFNKLTPESIELRPEDLVKGEVYRAFCDAMKVNRIFSFDKLMNGVWYYKMRNYTGEYYNNSYLADTFKFYHATPEEKALLLGEEEPTDWKSMYNELKTKYDQLEPKGEKVYFYWADRQYYCNVEKQEAIDNSDNFSEIYEAVCIGKKKSVLEKN